MSMRKETTDMEHKSIMNVVVYEKDSLIHGGKQDA